MSSNAAEKQTSISCGPWSFVLFLSHGQAKPKLARALWRSEQCVLDARGEGEAEGEGEVAPPLASEECPGFYANSKASYLLGFCSKASLTQIQALVKPLKQSSSQAATLSAGFALRAESDGRPRRRG